MHGPFIRNISAFDLLDYDREKPQERHPKLGGGPAADSGSSDRAVDSPPGPGSPFEEATAPPQPAFGIVGIGA